MLQSDEHKLAEITKNACGSKNYLRPHRHLLHNTMQNSKSRKKHTFPGFSAIFDELSAVFGFMRWEP